MIRRQEEHYGWEFLFVAANTDEVETASSIGIRSERAANYNYSDATPNEAEHIVISMIESGWKPIFAHTERYPNLFYEKTITHLISLGAMVQVNLYSLDEEHDVGLKNRARWLIENQYAHFLGSDAHRSNHRPPRYEKGI